MAHLQPLQLQIGIFMCMLIPTTVSHNEQPIKTSLDPRHHMLASLYAESAVLAAQLKLVGSCRGPDDQARLKQLQQYAQELDLSNCVEFCINVSFNELTSLLAGAVGGLHTMLDEHFGISIVEYMAAGKFALNHTLVAFI